MSIGPVGPARVLTDTFIWAGSSRTEPAGAFPEIAIKRQSFDRGIGLPLFHHRSDLTTVPPTTQTQHTWPISSLASLNIAQRAWRVNTQSWSYTLPATWTAWFGLRFVLIRKKRHGKGKLLVNFQIQPPLLQRVWSSSMSFQNYFLSGSMTYAYDRVVSEDDKFLLACREGDLYTVKLCCKDQIIPNVVSRSNMTPLLNAVESGKVDVVKFLLLECGADVNRCGGARQTSPLQWAIRHNHLDIIRTLMACQADLDWVSSLGWSPIFYCWPSWDATWIDRTDIIKLLHDRTVLTPNEADTEAWTALQRAAAFGTKKDVQLLLKIWSDFGANCRLETGEKRWEAIHYAVQAGNPETFEALIELYGDMVTGIRDDRGWSLLHIAATRPAEDVKDPTRILRQLLALGCDPNLSTLPTRSENLDGEAYTAEDIARKSGVLPYANYKQALGEHEKLKLET